MASEKKLTGAEALERLRNIENWESLKDFSFGEYESHGGKAGNRYGGYGETEWDESFESDGSWLDVDDAVASDDGVLSESPAFEGAAACDAADSGAVEKPAGKSAFAFRVSNEDLATRAHEVAEHDKSCNGLSQDERAMLSSYFELYKSRDGRMTVFSDADGHVVCVQTKRLA